MINVGIVGYGNLGRGVSKAILKSNDINCVGIFTRRAPENIKPLIDTKVYSVDDLVNFKDKIDVLLLCGGSATDLPQTTAQYLKDFNTVDSFDTHAKILEYSKNLEQVAKIRQIPDMTAIIDRTKQMTDMLIFKGKSLRG